MSYNSPPSQYPQQGYIPPQQGGYVQQVSIQQGGYSPQPQYQGGIPPQQFQQFQQPQQQQMYASTTQMNPQVVKEQVVYEGGLREWRFGLFDCLSDAGLSLKTCCCPCITYGETKAKVNNNPGSCVGHSLLYFCIQGFFRLGCILGSIQRNEMRAKYQIDGTPLGDFATHFCCGCCALMQENREANSML